MVVENFPSLPQQQRRYVSDQESATLRHPLSQEHNIMSSHPRNALPMQQLLAMRSVEDHPAMYGSPNAPGLHQPVGLDLVGLAGLSRDVPNQLLAAQQAALQAQRKQREFIPDAKKDESYWDRRRRNNEAAKRSREKRRLNDMVLETRVVELYKENHVLRAQLAAIRDKYGINAENLVSVEQVLATLPSPEQLINVTRTRPRILPVGPNLSCMSPLHYSQSLSPTPSCTGTSPAVHQRQSVLMSVGGQHQRSPSPPVVSFAESPLFQETGKTDNRPIDVASQRRSYEEATIARQQPLIPVAAPTSTPNGRPMENDRCSPSSNNGLHSGDDGSRSPVDPAATMGRVLPHKLRHKTHLGDRDSAAAATALLILNDIKHEAEAEIDTVDLEEENVRSGGSSDERDSGISSTDWSMSHTVSHVSDSEEPPCKKATRDRLVRPPKSADSNKHGGDQELRSKLARLVSEVESIKHFLSANTNPQTLNVK